MKVVWAPNIGLEELWGLHTLELVKPIPAQAGRMKVDGFWFLANGQRLTTNDASPEDDI